MFSILPVVHRMLDPLAYLAFLGACLALVLVPGPSQALVVATTLARGPRAGAFTAVGLNVGTLVHALAAALGVSAILATSAAAFTVVKLAGAGYLLVLGVRTLRSRAHAAAPAAPGSGSFAHAVAAGVLNPKVAIFFLAFLPQFVHPERGHVLAQFVVLGASLALLDTVYELLLVALVVRLRGRLAGDSRFDAWRRRVSGLVLVGLGLRLAAESR